MIIFEEELKKFNRSLEIADTEDAVYSEDLTDMMDIFINLANHYDETVIDTTVENNE
ncbi:MAG: hypothetical protein IJ600_11810 [Lachnospiraceae bacterium]|nr:hypothetical protein [Lachnospiraceae bacterium]